MHRVVHVCDGVVRPVNRQCVLNQVVGANRQKVEVFDEVRKRQHRRWNFNHAADGHVVIVCDTLRNQLGFGSRDKAQRLRNFMCVCQHRHQDAHSTKRAGAQYRPQLRHKKFGFSQTQADRAQTQCRVVARAITEARHAFIGAKIECANGDGAALQAFNGRFVSLELLVFARQIFAMHEQKFGAE